jgi:alanyl-tRNA synthetase
VRSTAEIGLLKITSEGSSAANVRRIEAITGPEAVAHARGHDALLHEAARALRTQPDRVPEAIADLQRKAKQAAKASTGAGLDVDGLAAAGEALDGARVVIQAVDVADVKALVDAADRVKGRLGDAAAVVLGAAADERVHLVAAVTPELVSRGVKAGEVVKIAAGVVGGGGGGRDTMAQAGGREPAKLPEALDAARAAIAQALSA